MSFNPAEFSIRNRLLILIVIIRRAKELSIALDTSVSSNLTTTQEMRRTN